MTVVPAPIVFSEWEYVECIAKYLTDNKTYKISGLLLRDFPSNDSSLSLLICIKLKLITALTVH